MRDELKGSRSEMPTSPTAPTPPLATANEFIEHQLDERLGAVEDACDAHAVSMNCPILGGVDDILRKAIEKRHGLARQKRSLS